MKRQHANSDGFTIIELMIALSVLAIILVASTVIMIQISALYSKGLNMANLQTDTRNVSQDVVAQLQFSGNSFKQGAATQAGPSGPVAVQSYCVGATRYTYVLHHELGTDNGLTPAVTTDHVLWRDTMKDTSLGCPPMAIANSANPNNNGDPTSSNDGYEMMGDHMSLEAFNINQVGTGTVMYDIAVWTAFGDSDLVNRNSWPALPTCKGGTGTQFCAVSEVNSSATERVN